MKPKIFVGSSVEGVSIAYAIQENLDFFAEVTVWPQGVFDLSKFTLQSLIESLDKFDFSIFVFSPDDIKLIRNESQITVRDNVLFELGLFIGRLGLENSFVFLPVDSDIYLPTDLLGLTPAMYNLDRSDDNINAALGPACNKVRRRIKNDPYYSKGMETTNTNKPEKSEMDNITQDLKGVIEKLEKAQGNGSLGVNSGFYELDNIFPGWQKGSLHIIAGTAGMGKSTLLLDFARNATLDTDKPISVEILSLEFTKEQCVERILFAESRVGSIPSNMVNIKKEDWSRISKAAGRLSTLGLFIDHFQKLSIDVLKATIRNLVSDQSIELLIIDSLHSITLSEDESKGLKKTGIGYGYIAQELKSLAMECEIPIIASARLSKATEQRGGGNRPILSDIYGSSDIVDLADLVMFIYRPELYGYTTNEEGMSTAGLAEIIVAKNRFGPTKSFNLYFVKDYRRFESLFDF